MNWAEIHGFGGWAAALEQLVVDLAGAFAAKSETQKNGALQNLRDFIKFSPNDVAGSLDDIALRTVLDTVAKNWEEGSAELAARSAELAKLIKQVRSITAANEETAENIRMTRITAVIDGSTALLKSFTELKKQLELDGLTDTDNAIKKLKSAINAVQNLRNDVEAL